MSALRWLLDWISGTGLLAPTFHQQPCSSLVSAMTELNNLIARGEMRLEQLIIHVRENRNAAEVEVERIYLLALLEDLARLKGERQRLEEEMELARAAPFAGIGVG